MGIINPHDAFFKEIFSDKENTVDFIQGVLPEELKKDLDLSTLTLDNNSYVDEELKGIIKKRTEILQEIKWIILSDTTY